MIAIVEFEKFVLNIDIFNIVIYKVSYNKKHYLMILLKFEKNLGINFYSTILTLSSTVNL